MRMSVSSPASRLLSAHWQKQPCKRSPPPRGPGICGFRTTIPATMCRSAPAQRAWRGPNLTCHRYAEPVLLSVSKRNDLSSFSSLCYLQKVKRWAIILTVKIVGFFVHIIYNCAYIMICISPTITIIQSLKMMCGHKLHLTIRTCEMACGSSQPAGVRLQDVD